MPATEDDLSTVRRDIGEAQNRGASSGSQQPQTCSSLMPHRASETEGDSRSAACLAVLSGIVPPG
jgi:hypothetical protein